MLAELVGFLGTSVGGAIFGQIASIIQSSADLKIAREKRQHEKDLAYSGQLVSYYASLGKSSPGTAHALHSVIWLLALTYCACTLACFLWPSAVVYALDPESVPRKISFLFGLFAYDFGTSRHVIELTTGGVGLMLCYPLVFILSAVCTGIVPKKIR